MKLIYAGGTFCALPTLKRLIALADEIGFIDRPSVTFNRPMLSVKETLSSGLPPSTDGSWGTVGFPSIAHRLVNAFKGKPVGLAICTPPSGPARGIYREYIEADLVNLNLRRIVLEGLQADDCFANKLIGLDANYGSCTGREVVAAIGRDPSLATIEFKDLLLSARPYQIDDPASIRESVKMIVVEASIQLTNAMLFSLRDEIVPVTDDRFFEALLAMRLSDKKYVGETPVVAPLLGLEVIKSVIPDDVLEKLKLTDILDYREEAKSAHAAWSSEIARLAATLDDVSPEDWDREIPRLIAREVSPQLVEYRHAMEGARDKLFGDLIKSVTHWRVPVITIGALNYFSPHQALSAFATLSGVALTSALPAVVDAVVSRRGVRRKHAVSYLVGIADR